MPYGITTPSDTEKVVLCSLDTSWSEFIIAPKENDDFKTNKGGSTQKPISHHMNNKKYLFLMQTCQ